MGKHNAFQHVCSLRLLILNRHWLLRTTEYQLFPEGVPDGPIVQRSVKQDVNVLRDFRLQITDGPDTISVR